MIRRKYVIDKIISIINKFLQNALNQTGQVLALKANS